MPGARRFIVRGRVQGVFFRDSTRQVAKSLGLLGHAVNQPDGSVEVVAYGDHEAIARLQEWLKKGPPLSSVASVDASDIELPRPDGFRTA